ncbi:lipopolysaccharide biosynthesis protein [Neorhizobium galegae]|uniref:Oligosaccharide flippase family protein n=1 Tax=Neorhizobium galegae TaxID=399 RepID=A0A6A1TXE9_NEOGA|nr:polysaccharide biosynthesis C-terminal domain-containing protein [Neorhizobium galegae]KAB1088174.1 oligosaccharide flippase family protein [Neorhizobium galegae]
MSDRHASVYLASRATSAIINLVSVSIFTRMTSADVYGQYIIGFSICMMVYSLGVQWIVFAHFGRYDPREADRLAGALLLVSGIVMLPAVGAIYLFYLFGTLHADVAASSSLLVVCFTLYFVAVEISRAHLLVRLVAIATIARSVFSLLFGFIAVLEFETPGALLAGVGLGYALGSVPVFRHFSRTIWASGFVWPRSSDVRRMWRYGWPLAIAFGASAAAMNVDRLLLAGLYNTSTVAPYGTVLDLMKQTFLVLAEAISAGYISSAKNLHTEGKGSDARHTLKRAFITQCYIVIFGTVSFILLGDVVFAVLLAPSYLPVVTQIMPILLVANALLVMRSHYFGQVIYFSGTTNLELVASVAMLAVTGTLSYLLIPSYSAMGAAIAFTLGQAAALLICLIYASGNLRMPLDLPRGSLLLALGIALVAVGKGVQLVAGEPVASAINFVLIGIASAYIALRWNLFDARSLLQRFYPRRG